MDTHPIRLVVTDDLKRSRLTVFFRYLLAIPHMFWMMLWGIAVYLAVFVSWFATFILGRTPRGLHDFIARFLRYMTQVYAYTYLLADPYPAFSGAPGYPVDLEIDPPAPQRRIVTFFRFLLAIPAFFLAGVFGYVIGMVAFLGWFVCLVIGRMPEGMRNLSAWCLRYQTQTYGYAMLLTDRYPTLSGAPSA